MDKGKIINMPLERAIIQARFHHELKKIDKKFFNLFLTRNTNYPHSNIIMNIPYWIYENMNQELPLNDLRSFALGNLFGAVYILIQDRVLDDPKFFIKDKSAARQFLMSNVIYYKWIKEYQRVFRSDDYFWAIFEKYLLEYTNANIWEKENHWNILNEFQPNDFVYLGQKFSLLKISCAGLLLLDNRIELINPFSDLIEKYHIAYQLIDDLNDWQDDITNGNYTYLITQISILTDNFNDKERIKNILHSSDIVEQLVCLSEKYYTEAMEISNNLNYRKLSDHIKTLKNSSINLLKIYGKAYEKIEQVNKKKLMDNDISLRKAAVKEFTANGSKYIYDINRITTLKIDIPVSRILSSFNGIEVLQFDKLMNQIDKDIPADTKEIVEELCSYGILEIADDANYTVRQIDEIEQSSEIIHTIEIFLTTNIDNHTQVISTDQIKKYINFLFQNSGRFEILTLHFFNLGNVLKTSPVLENANQYASSLAAKLNKTIYTALHMNLINITENLISLVAKFRPSALSINISSETTNITDEILNLLKELNAITLCSFSFNKINSIMIQALQKAGFKNIWINNLESCDNLDDSLYIYPEWLLPNIIKRINQLDRHQPSKYYCNAGKSQIAITPNGNIYPCHKFAKTQALRMGNISDGQKLNQMPFIQRNIDNMPACSHCWAKGLCGGGCMYESYLQAQDIKSINEDRCNSIREISEFSILKRLELEKDVKNKLANIICKDLHLCEGY